MHVCVLVTPLCLTLCDPMDCSPPGSSPWNSPGKNIGVGCHFLFQGVFLTQELNLGLLHCRQTLYQLSHREYALKDVNFCRSISLPAFLTPSALQCSMPLSPPSGVTAPCLLPSVPMSLVAAQPLIFEVLWLRSVRGLFPRSSLAAFSPWSHR